MNPKFKVGQVVRFEGCQTHKRCNTCADKCNYPIISHGEINSIEWCGSIAHQHFHYFIKESVIDENMILLAN
jgi:hypothetical protein